MCLYIKDDGEQCGRDAYPFCHDHEETEFAAKFLLASEALEQLKEPFEPEWTPTTCDECESAVRVVCARIDEAAFQPQSVIPTFALTCPCGESVMWDPTTKQLPKSEVPDKWLFPRDR